MCFANHAICFHSCLMWLRSWHDIAYCTRKVSPSVTPAFVILFHSMCWRLYKTCVFVLRMAGGLFVALVARYGDVLAQSRGRLERQLATWQRPGVASAAASAQVATAAWRPGARERHEQRDAGHLRIGAQVADQVDSGRKGPVGHAGQFAALRNAAHRRQTSGPGRRRAQVRHSGSGLRKREHQVRSAHWWSLPFGPPVARFADQAATRALDQGQSRYKSFLYRKELQFSKWTGITWYHPARLLVIHQL